MKNQTFKAGDLVRVSAHPSPNLGHAFKSGQLCEVVRMGGWGGYPSRVLVKGNFRGHPLEQSIRVRCVKLAKQAMKKREVYASRRG